jgi:hypothetical protein
VLLNWYKLNLNMMFPQFFLLGYKACAVQWKSADVSKEHIISVFSVKVYSWATKQHEAGIKAELCSSAWYVMLYPRRRNTSELNLTSNYKFMPSVPNFLVGTHGWTIMTSLSRVHFVCFMLSWLATWSWVLLDKLIIAITYFPSFMEPVTNTRSATWSCPEQDQSAPKM